MDSTAPDDLGGRKAATGAFMESALASFGLPMNLTAVVISDVLFLSMRAGIGILVTRHVAKVTGDINTAERLKVIRTLMQAQRDCYARQRLNSLVAAAGHSSNAAGHTLQVSAEPITALLQILIYVLICTLIAPTMIPIAMTVVAIMAVTHGTLVRNSKRAAKGERIAMSRMRADLTDVFVGIKSIRAMGRQAQMQSLLSNDSDTLNERMKSQVVSAEYAEQLQVPLIGGCL